MYTVYITLVITCLFHPQCALGFAQKTNTGKNQLVLDHVEVAGDTNYIKHAQIRYVL